MTPRRSALGWGVALMAVGVVLLLRNAGLVPADVAVWPWALLAAGAALLPRATSTEGSGRALPVALVVVGGVFSLREVGALPLEIGIWPVALIAAGVFLLTRGMSDRKTVPATTATSFDLDGAAAARVKFSYGAGILRVADGAAAGLLYEGSFLGGIRQETERHGDELDIALRHASDFPRALGSSRGLDWDVRLATDIPLDLDVRTGASRVKADLSELQVRSLSIETGASDVDVVLPARQSCRVQIEAGAADVAIRVPTGVAASVRTSSALASVDIDGSRFPRVGGTHRSHDYDTAAFRADIEIEGGLSSFSVR